MRGIISPLLLQVQREGVRGSWPESCRRQRSARPRKGETETYEAHDQVKFTAASEGWGVPAQKGAYFEVRERNSVF